MDKNMSRKNSNDKNGHNFYSFRRAEQPFPRQRTSINTKRRSRHLGTSSQKIHPRRQVSINEKDKVLRLVFSTRGIILMFVFVLNSFIIYNIWSDGFINHEDDVGVSIRDASSIHIESGLTPSRSKNKSSKTPVIIVPGGLGSILEAKLNKEDNGGGMMCSTVSDWYTLWISESAMIAQKCFFDNIKMKYNRITSDGGDGLTSPKNEGVQVRVPFYGSSVKGIRCMLPHSEEKCHATRNWKTIIDKLGSLGYTVGIDLFSAPYDFRKGPDDFILDEFPKLKLLVEQVHTQSEQKVKIVSVSMGGQFVHTFLTHFVDQEWKDVHIDSWLSLSGIFNGFTQAIQNVAFGRNQFLGFSVFQQTDIRDAYRSWFSSCWLIPKPIFGDNRVILETPSRQYRLTDIPDLLHGDQREMYLRSFKYNSKADPGVPVGCWYSRHFETVTSLKVNVDLDEGTYNSPSGINVIEIKGGYGDGAVDAESLSICKGWNSTYEAREVQICHGCLLDSIGAAVYLASERNRPADTRGNTTVSDKE